MTEVLKVTHVTKKYGDTVVLDDVSFCVEKGSYVGLIGPNGAGKSTLLKIILDLEKPTQGSITIAPGTTIGYVPQHYDLQSVVPIAVHEVLGMAHTSIMRHTHHYRDYKNVLRSVQLDDAFLTQNFHTLSGGQKQRVIIARALMHNPDFLLFDEPLSGVDFETKIAIYDVLHTLHKKHHMTIIFVSHEVKQVIRKCDRVLCLDRSIHKGCHPVQFARGKKQTCDVRHGAVHHHH